MAMRVLKRKRTVSHGCCYVGTAGISTSSDGQNTAALVKHFSHEYIVCLISEMIHCARNEQL